MSVASSGDAGLPSADPSRSSMESQLSTRESGHRAATAVPLRSASTTTARAVPIAPMCSLTPLTTTSGSNPASRRTRRRAGEAEARINRGAMAEPYQRPPGSPYEGDPARLPGGRKRNGHAPPGWRGCVPASYERARQSPARNSLTRPPTMVTSPSGWPSSPHTVYAPSRSSG